MTAQRAKIFLTITGGTWLILLAVSLRIERPEFRPWELLYQRETSRFTPEQRIEMTEIGDLGWKSWVRALQQPRPVVFTTDRYGWRNPPGLDHLDVVILGDSYVAGAGLSDDETLAARMRARLGATVYSYASQTADSPALFLADERFQSNPPKVVIYAPTSRAFRPRPLVYRPRPRPPETAMDRYRAIGAAVKRFVEVINRDNGLVRLMRYEFQGLRYRMFGHPQQIQTRQGPALALPLLEQGLLSSPSPAMVEGCSQMVLAMHRLLARRGVRFLFAPIPESGSIYPELFPEGDRRRMVRSGLVDLVLERVSAAGVETVDLRPTFRANKDPYLFHRDDTHWSPRAVDIAADVLSKAVQRGPAPSLEPLESSPPFLLPEHRVIEAPSE